MGAAIKLVSPINETETEQQADYLLPAVVQPKAEETNVSLDELKSLLVEVRSLRVQLAQSQHLLRQREALLHNARVREQELRNSLFNL